MAMEAEVPGIGDVGCYAERQCPRCCKRKRKPQPSLVTPGALQVLPQEEEKERAFTRRFITFCLSKVSKETAQYIDSVNRCDPSKVAAQLEAVLFENWGFNDQTLESTKKYSTLFSFLHTPAIKDFRRQVLLGQISPEQLVNMSTDELHRKYPLDDLCENCCKFTMKPLGTKLLMQKEHLPLGLEPCGTSVLEVLPREEEKERSFARRFITFCLSKVSKETDEKYMDSVNACDPSKVAAQLEAVLFENWGFNDQTLLSTRKYSAVFSCLHRSAIKDFRRQVLLGEISPKQLVSMSPDEVYEMCKPRSDDTQICITRFH
ncbi:uncharacterized protein LOC126591503 [Malus sylvestris]|uniref:uncharacterized protein LOC126591503 n=1 Tax=Malus sylvestris TaxID=3752 RepID=UPI0021ACE990|nr:uncharacterized protein LOC126591503 [Malus sylvestris]